MHSLKTRITLLTVIVIVIAMTVATAFGVVAIGKTGRQSANQSLMLLCETGQKNLNHYFESVEQSVEMVSAYVESDLDGIDEAHLQAHLNRASDIFKKLTNNTFGVLTYYYRIDPSVSTKAKGFWYVNLDGEGFKEHEVTDITQYDTADTSQLVWFTVPKYEGKAVWLPPYITDNLDVRVLSYNVPVYYQGTFVGVIGIEIDYSTMAEQVDNITLYENGYAFINDAEGTIIYHPRMDVTMMDEHPKIPAGLLDADYSVTYTFDGVKKQAVWLPLENGMRLNVSVPVSEINAEWERYSVEMVVTLLLMLALFVTLTMRFVGRITKPLTDLTEMAEQVEAGNYDCRSDYEGDDEIGILARTFNKLTSHLKVYISDLNDLAYADSLTSVHNKGAFDICIRDMETEIAEMSDPTEFAVCIFDCNDLKEVNDQNGHDKGDIYLQEAAKMICGVFDHSPVFRIGGDEFATLLTNGDFEKRDELVKLFEERCAEKQRTEDDAWEKVDVACGMAVYDPAEDDSVSDVVRRADKLMYENKWKMKAARREDAESVHNGE